VPRRATNAHRPVGPAGGRPGETWSCRVVELRPRVARRFEAKVSADLTRSCFAFCCGWERLPCCFVLDSAGFEHATATRRYRDFGGRLISDEV
jgi:hypothetical protein